MTNAEIIATIRNEIERLKGICTAQIKANPGQTFPFVMEMTGYDKLLSFLSTLGSEKPMQDGLEEELERFIASGKSVTVDDCGSYKVSYHDFKKVARHFVEWQKEQDTREMIMSDGSYFQKCYELGKKDMKEQMMKEAVKGTIYGNGGYTWVAGDIPSQFKYGDKVKIIIVKEDGK